MRFGKDRAGNVHLLRDVAHRCDAEPHALLDAGILRLRPVLMTTAATVFGHFPLVLVSGPGSAARNSIGTSLVAGMAVGTLFTLFVVPVFYTLVARDHRAVVKESEPAGGFEPALEGVANA